MSVFSFFFFLFWFGWEGEILDCIWNKLSLGFNEWFGFSCFVMVFSFGVNTFEFFYAGLNFEY